MLTHSNFLEDTLLQKSSTPTSTLVFDILLIYPSIPVQELLTNIPLPITNSTLSIPTLLSTLSEFLNEQEISYFNPVDHLYISCGTLAHPANDTIPISELFHKQGKYALSLRIAPKAILSLDKTLNELVSYFDGLIQEKDLVEEDKIDKKVEEIVQLASPSLTASSCSQSLRKKKERKIKAVEELVSRWESLTRGNVDLNTGILVKLSAEEAAEKVGLPVSALRNYLTKISKARKLGFDFSGHANEDFKVLSDFVGKKKVRISSSDDSDNDDNRPVAKVPLCKRIPNKKIA